MKTSDLVKGVLGGATVAAGLYAGKYIRKQNFLGLDPLYQDLIHIGVGAVAIPMLAKGKSAGYLNKFGEALAGEAILDIVNSYLPADYQVSGTDNASYALGYPAVAGYDNRADALAGTQPFEARNSVPYMMAG